MESANVNSYAPPVNKLLIYGEAKDSRPNRWPDYLELGLGPEHISELIRMATDENLNWADSTSLEVWAPTHAWRALGQLRSEAAVEPLLSLFKTLDEDEWVPDEIPEVMGMIGPAALPALARFIADGLSDEHTRIGAMSSIDQIGNRWPEARSACIEILVRQLELFAENEPEINAFLILSLVKLKATEALPLIERAFTAGSVDESILGDWEDVQVEFGLKSEEEVEARRMRRLPETPFPSRVQQAVVQQVSSKERHQREAGHKKAKSKMANKSRKKNRKR
jgi:PBS lyase HEAT-like repeat